MAISSLVLLLLFLVTLALVFLSLRLRGDEAGPGPRGLSRFLLVALRLAIGWHFFIEAAEKLHDPAWTSAEYLRESTGPLAPLFRGMAGDRLIDQLTLGPGNAFPEELDIRWQAYLDAFADYYILNDSQRERAQGVLDQSKDKAVEWLSSKKRHVRRITDSDDSPPVYVSWTMPERLAEYKRFKDAVLRIEEEDLGRYGGDAEKNWKAAKGKLGKWRGGLQRDLVLLDREYQRGLRTLLLGFAKNALIASDQVKLDKALADAETKRKGKKRLAVNPEEWEKVDAQQHEADEDALFQYRAYFSRLKASGDHESFDDQTRRIHEHAIDLKKAPATSYDLIPRRVGRPLSSWTFLDLGDFAVKWGLLVVGLLLLVGLLTRTACVLGAVYLLMFYLAMPALPGWPPSPRAEGHYLFINKNLIEMLALLALATFRTGRWAGLDGIFGAFRRERVEQEKELPFPVR